MVELNCRYWPNEEPWTCQIFAAHLDSRIPVRRDQIAITFNSAIIRPFFMLWKEICTTPTMSTRPFEVLALGLSRSGTDSLKIGLHILVTTIPTTAVTDTGGGDTNITRADFASMA